MSSEEEKQTLNSLLTDKNFMLKILNMESSEDVKKEFENHGVKITEEELKNLGIALDSIFSIVNKMDKNEVGKLKKAAQSPNFLNLGAVFGGGGKDVLGGALGVLGASVNLVGTFKDANAKVDVADKNLEGKRVELEQERLKLQGKEIGASATLGAVTSAKQIGVAAIVLGTALGALVIFKDDIRAWFRKSKK